MIEMALDKETLERISKMTDEEKEQRAREVKKELAEMKNNEHELFCQIPSTVKADVDIALNAV